MAVKVSVTKALETKLRKLSSDPNELGAICRQLLSLVEDAREKQVKQKGLDPREVVSAIRHVLGSQAALPPNPGPAFYGYIKRRCVFLGLTIEDVEKAAYRAKATYRLPTSVEWIVKTIDRLLQDDEPDVVAAPEVELNTGRLGDEW